MLAARVLFSSWGGRVVDNRGKALEEIEPAQGLLLPDHFRDGEKIKALAGWNGIVLVSDEVDIVDLCRAHLEAVREESKKCDKCNYCSTGYNELLDVFQDMAKGEARQEDLEFLRSAAEAIREAGKCSTGKTGPIPLLDALEFFKGEFLALIQGHRRLTEGTYRSCLTAPCMEACPIHLDIPRYVERIKEAKFAQSLEIITERLPLPGVLGRICLRPCESNCRRANVDKPIAIKALKRFVADQAMMSGRLTRWEVTPSPRTGKVAVVGAGPAGICCAYHLARRGHRVKVFEMLNEPGGMSAVGIPSYRLSRDVLRREVGLLQDLDVEFSYNQAVGKDLSLSQLEQDFDAVFLGIGAQSSVPLRIEGENQGYQGVIPGLEYLKGISQGRDPYPEGQVVAVIGGGNVAIDCARSSLRMGKREVIIVYRRGKEQMSADSEEIRDAEEEGVVFHYLTSPLKILAKDGKVFGIQCTRMKLGEPEEDGRPRTVPIPGSEFLLSCDTVVTAVGQQVDVSTWEGVEGLLMTKWNSLMVDEATKQTSRPKIFAAGDCETGPDTFIGACAGGRRAAQSIDRFINGVPLGPDEETCFERLLESISVYDPGEEIPRVEVLERRRPNRLSPESRRCSWAEVEETFQVQEAVAEAERCLRCYYVATLAL